MSLTSAALRANRFDATGFVPFLCGDEQIGWLRPDFAARLARWPKCFQASPDQVALHASLSTVDARTQALAECVRALARDGTITGWRDETYAIRSTVDGSALFHVERAAMHRFGLTAYGANLNGYVADAAPPRMWIARRSDSKPLDPGMLDTLVGGGIASGFSAWDTMVKESGEEAGIPATLASQAVYTGCVQTCREVPDGLHREFVFTWDLDLPASFAPANQDGEVSQVQLLGVDEILDELAREAFTVEASLVALDSLLRRGWIDHARRDFQPLSDAVLASRIALPPI